MEKAKETNTKKTHIYIYSIQFRNEINKLWKRQKKKPPKNHTYIYTRYLYPGTQMRKVVRQNDFYFETKIRWVAKYTIYFIEEYLEAIIT